MTSPEPRQERPRSHLFTVRVWKEAMRDAMTHDAYELRMQVRHVLSGEVHYFRDWQALVEYLQRVIRVRDQTE